MTDTIAFTATDGSTQLVTVTVNGAEDAPVLGGVTTGTVAENGATTASGLLTITDVDTADNPVNWVDEAATGGDNGYGTFEITGGTWTYILDKTHASVQALKGGESLSDKYTFTASDSSTQLVTVTINGIQDMAVISGTDTGGVTEDVDPNNNGLLEASGRLVVTDADAGEEVSVSCLFGF